MTILRIHYFLISLWPPELKWLRLSVLRGGSRIFSRGGGGGANFQKPFENVLDLFLRPTKHFSELSQSTKKTLFAQIFCAAGQILKQQAQKGVLVSFLKTLTKK